MVAGEVVPSILCAEYRHQQRKRSAANEESTYRNTLRLLQVPAAGIVQSVSPFKHHAQNSRFCARSMTVTAFAAISLSFANPTLHIAPASGASVETTEFPRWVRMVFAIIAVVRVLYCAAVYYAFVQLGLPSASAGRGDQTI